MLHTAGHKEGIAALAPILSILMRNLISRFVDSNDRVVDKLQPLVDEINSLEAEFEALSDDEIRERMIALRAEVMAEAAPSEPSADELQNESSERRRELRKAREKDDFKHLQGVLDDVLPEVFAAAREVSRRKLGMRHFDVQLIGGIVLHQGKIAEMKTGEGKTLVAPLAAALNAMPGAASTSSPSTTTSPSATRSGWGRSSTGSACRVGIIQHETAFIFDPDHRGTRRAADPPAAGRPREAYAADITYGTNNEFGFDYLRDNMVTELEQRVQRERYFAHRRRGRQHPHRRGAHAADHQRPGRGGGGPLLPVRAARASSARTAGRCRRGRRLLHRPQGARRRADRGGHRQDRATARASTNMFDADPRLARHFEQALKAHALYQRDGTTSSNDGEIVIVDEFTGRMMPGRRWSEGLHQAIEAKEGLRVQRETVTLATITFQNYFRLYEKLAGMTGTAMTEPEEFHKIYDLDVVAIPTNRPMVREDSRRPRLPDRERQVHRR